MTETAGINLHEDETLFRETVNFAASRTGFSARLVEQDYFCTVLLSYLVSRCGDQLVFKGGTCLAKVHAGFYRLSEDLDFTIPMPVDASRNQRRQVVAKIKNAVAVVADYLPVFAVAKPLTGANNSTQYNGAIAYRSTTTGQQQNILIEVSVREPLLMSADKTQAMTMLCDPINGKAIVPGIKLNCITWDEVWLN